MEKQKIFIFGAGATGHTLLPILSQKYHILGFIDNFPRAINSNLPIYSPEILAQQQYDKVVITSVIAMQEIYEQLINLGIPIHKIDREFVSVSYNARIYFLENLGRIFEATNVTASVAEGGVFKGDFAKEINRVFPKSKLYLFDTFEGFDQRDIQTDLANGYSRSMTEVQFSNTNENLVLSQLPYPQMVEIRKGFFPETATGLDQEKFCFVNLDFDLYEPILAGLEFFAPKMIQGGVILIHDYFSETYRGVKEAIRVYTEKTGKNFFPIGDAYSVAIQF